MSEEFCKLGPEPARTIIQPRRFERGRRRGGGGFLPPAWRAEQPFGGHPACDEMEGAMTSFREETRI